MIELPADRANVRPWIVCESGNRWMTAVRRFVAEMMPPGLAASVIAAEPAKVHAMISPRRPSVVLWEFQPSLFAAVCDAVAATTIAAPKTLQIVASETLSRRQQFVLSELRVTATLRHVEELPRLTGLIQGYFASVPDNLD